ncbi:MAG: extracellular solute-binding protein [Planctomycetota bacterium]|nr:extracellular solute-binding protein [Planctomycetota bacterium]
MGIRSALSLAAFMLVVMIPLLWGGTRSDAPVTDAASKIVIVTPHVAQIRFEFERGFARWLRATGRDPVSIDWRTPGGTSEIIKQLEAVYSAAIKSGAIAPDGSCPPGTVPVDLAFGGGSFDHGRLKAGVSVLLPAQDANPRDVKLSMSVPAGFSQQQLDEWFGENAIGAQAVYDPEQHWIGTALSSFGIVYNRELYRDELMIPEPTSFEDLARPELAGWLALADPRQSGSLTTTLDSILSSLGWDEGWKLLRAMGANTRYFTNASIKPPIDVSQGEAAAGLAIDFYGRGQAQAIALPGQSPAEVRVAYVEPAGRVYVDADPISLLRGGPRPELARLFIEFLLTPEGQAIWNYRARTDPAHAANPKAADGMPAGPERYELRRLPVRRMMYDPSGPFYAALIDQINPYTLASNTKTAGWRSAIGLMMGAFSIDTADEQRAAWRALIRAERQANLPQERLQQLRAEFFSFPPHTLSDGSTLDFTQANFKAIRDDWRKPGVQARARVEYTEYFRQTYERIRRELERREPERELATQPRRVTAGGS